MSKTIVLPSGETSREIHDASSVVKLSLRGVISGNELVLAAALTALSFCAGVCARSGATVRIVIARVDPSGRRDIIERSPNSRWRRLECAATGRVVQGYESRGKGASERPVSIPCPRIGGSCSGAPCQPGPLVAWCGFSLPAAPPPHP